MGSFTSTAGRIAIAMLAETTLIAASSAANAQAAPSPVPVIPVSCDSTKLPTAIDQANFLGTAIVRLAEKCTYLTKESLPVTGVNVTIVGPPTATIKADPTAGPFGAILTVAQGATLHAKNFFILGGAQNKASSGGGIDNSGTLTLESMIISGNDAVEGGGLKNNQNAKALISHSVFKTNTGRFGGGINNAGALTVYKTLISGNSAQQGGGIFNYGPGVARIVESTFDKNSASQKGGAIANEAKISLVRSMVQQNKANLATSASAGGIANDAATAGSVTVASSTISGNTPNNCTSPATAPILGCLG